MWHFLFILLSAHCSCPVMAYHHCKNLKQFIQPRNTAPWSNYTGKLCHRGKQWQLPYGERGMRKPSHGGKWKSNEGIDNIPGPVNNMSFFMLWTDIFQAFHLSKCAWNLNCHCGRRVIHLPHYGNCHYGTSHGGIISLCRVTLSRPVNLNTTYTLKVFKLTFVHLISDLDDW